ncbi:helix-turn-helix domain-containing protein [Stratiformator vulcanicus]|uniref:DNA binding HTH domain-containing protein n=1 Tax=Stratiformator vulcanicus TaxID=2527980 RepID=A0A517R752_9PLAN|nr:helix-turn-helix domain-containing protein [Stratiformator vulcanicus]QDT39710.1 hypothetical protein Pan189_41190 [Stratiformator vulcanicus]
MSDRVTSTQFPDEAVELLRSMAESQRLIAESLQALCSQSRLPPAEKTAEPHPRNIEREAILALLDQDRPNLSKVAREVGVARQTLYDYPTLMAWWERLKGGGDLSRVRRGHRASDGSIEAYD